MDVLDTLKERGYVAQISDEEALRSALSGGPVTLYCGYDPTASSLHMGHLVSIMMLAHFQRAGHRPIVIVGGGTGMVGDPTDRIEMRRLLSLDDIRANMEGMRPQFGRYLDFGEGQAAALMLNNADWLLPLGYLEFLREIGRYFSVNQMLQHSTYRERVESEGLNFIEFNYLLLQAYDYLHLYREHGCRLQIGGQDQWFNIMAGTDLVRRVAGGQAYGLVAPLLMTSAGQKMGKTARGAVWLDPDQTSPYDYYQYWVNTADDDVKRFLALFTFLPMEQIQEMGRLQGADLREAKETLAFEATRLSHGSEAADAAQSASRALFGGEGEAEGAPTTKIAAARFAEGLGLASLVVETGLARSRAEATRLIQQGGISVNGERIDSPNVHIDEGYVREGAVLLRAGRKRFHRVVVEGS